MKYLCVTVAVVLLFAASCGDDSPTKAKITEPESSPYSGFFWISDTLDNNSCAVTAPPGGYVNVTVMGNYILFSGFAGTWEESKAHGCGMSPETKAPINLSKECYGYYTTVFGITYYDYNSFVGYYHVDYRYSAGCNSQPCSFTYRIGGRRLLERNAVPE